MPLWLCGWQKAFAMNEKIINQLPSILVTGGSGFVGIRLVRALSDNGYRVRITVRDLSKADYFKKLNVEVCSCNIRDEEEVRRAVQGIDGVQKVIKAVFKTVFFC